MTDLKLSAWHQKSLFFASLYLIYYTHLSQICQILSHFFSSLGVFAEVQQPLVCLLECDINLPEVYTGVPVIFTAVIFNQTLLPTTFEWGKVGSLWL